MEPNFKTSFIPKSPVISTPESRAAKKKGGSNIFNMIGTGVFVLTLLFWGGAFGYKKLLENQIVKADEELNAARTELDADRIQGLLDDNMKVAWSKELLDKHVVASEFLKKLGALTLKKIRYNDINYTNVAGSILLTMKGESKDYNALSLQSEVLSENEFIRSPSFSTITLKENGNIDFALTADVNTSLVSYKKLIESLNPPQTVTTQTQSVSSGGDLGDLENELNNTEVTQ